MSHAERLRRMPRLIVDRELRKRGSASMLTLAYAIRDEMPPGELERLGIAELLRARLQRGGYMGVAKDRMEAIDRGAMTFAQRVTATMKKHGYITTEGRGQSKIVTATQKWINEYGKESEHERLYRGSAQYPSDRVAPNRDERGRFTFVCHGAGETENDRRAEEEDQSLGA